jgi:hypothetical protein
VHAQDGPGLEAPVSGLAFGHLLAAACLGLSPHKSTISQIATTSPPTTPCQLEREQASERAMRKHDLRLGRCVRAT